MSHFTLARRAMTADEKARAERLAKQGTGAWIYGAVFFGVIPTWLLGMIGGKVFGDAGLWGGRALGAAMLVAFAVSFARHARFMKQRADADVSGAEVEVFTVETTRTFALETDHSSVSPALCVDLGDGKLLLLDGPWATDPRIYGVEHTPPVDDPPWWNELPPPVSFPTARFTLVRLPHSGEVLSIRAEGEYVKPEKTVGADLGKVLPRPSELLDGSLDTLDASLAAWSRNRA